MKILNLNSYISEKKSISPLTIKQIKGLELEPKPLENPTIFDLECFDIIKTREGNYYVYLTTKCGKPELSIPKFAPDFYRVYEHLIISLGIENYRSDLTCGNGDGISQMSGQVPAVIKQTMDTVADATGVDMTEIVRQSTLENATKRTLNKE